MRRGFGLIGLVVTAILIAIVGVIAYQAGWSDGVAQHLQNAVAPDGGYPYPYYYGGPHFFGFGWIFGLLFFLFVIFIFFRIARFAMWGGRGWGYGGHRRWGQPGEMPQGIEERMREWHQRAHGEQAGAGSPPPPPPTDQKQA
jgi:hypothetical protein